MHTDMDSGHGGKSGRFKAYEDIALEYAFVAATEQDLARARAAAAVPADGEAAGPEEETP